MHTPVAGAPAPLSAADLERTGVYRTIALRLIPFLFVCYVVNFLDRTNIGFAQLALKDELGFSNAVYGFGASLFYVGYILFEVPSNMLLQRIGAPKTIMRIMVLWGLMSVAMAAVSSPLQFYVLRFLLGVGEAGFMPGILFYLSGWVPASQRARFTALFMIAIPISGVISGPISGGIMQFLAGAGGLRGWQWLFILEGAPAIVLGIIAAFVLAKGPADAKWLSPAQREGLLAAIRADSATSTRRAARLGEVLREPMLYVLAFYCVGMNGSIGGFSFWLPTIVKGFGVSNTFHVGLLVAIPYLAGAVALVLNGRHSDKTGERRWHAAGAMLAASFGWLLLPLAIHQPVIAMALITLATAGTIACLACFWSMVPLYFPAGAAIAFAGVSSLGSLGSLASPALVGWIATATGSVVNGTLYLGSVMLVAAACLIAATATRRTPQAGPSA
ncbi:MFS transporter [Bradyrhizobium sp. U87765 SZCCT0131]|uniref:MFS transporter n=1 Tax=unclassified Bradyrhizobium TaxID=2631580 RepID=UPI001BA4B211|nr:MULTISPECIES: MFS transporter [unclassified Bradyrhizobium]MBR1216880.1 MFS transporter [Bradyrhizobium sp. U87765 SZCCT0131]MBR1259364.1 MFS transporter [Bradyrhizobium sp. U87765 SZCCT0134]MBR1305505.1 MFS transporter [Bradyrhizobium sp. U87765 SZCCT0110]MBR1321872.1 MFS transporter [Bradyrhizobium sp. U87765 SZCCT0109]MBR1350850.1 MFS transporter [Bradyrhizobium sp. U87765 SZCCT0048]